jgi:hypothetical protein
VWYNDNTEARPAQTLREGINVIKITNSGTLTINRNDIHQGTLIISDITVVDADNGGLDLARLGLDSSEVSSVLQELDDKTKDSRGYSIFYYNNKLDNSSVIDVDTMSSEYAWFDYNNICNKFVISELDCENSFNEGIRLKKNSRL